MTTQAPGSLVFVTWNIDGLDQHNLKKRTKAVAKILEQEAADVVFLQEVIPETFSYLESKLPGYQVLHTLQTLQTLQTLLILHHNVHISIGGGFGYIGGKIERILKQNRGQI